MTEVHPVQPGWGSVDAEALAALHRAHDADPEAFWREQAGRLDWVRAPERVKDVSYDLADFRIRWFEDGLLNASANCLDRHLADRGEQVAILWEGDDPTETRTLTYRELHAEVCRMSNVLKGLGVGRGDRVTIYLPMIPEAAAAMLACARIGAVHSVVFAGFSPEALAGRIQDCSSRVVITADEGVRAGKRIPLKANVDRALEQCPGVEHVLVVARTGADAPLEPGRDVPWDVARMEASDDCPPEPMGAEDPLFILYTSGSTGKPKGVLHTTGGYVFWAAWTHALVFDPRPDEVYWCTADVGWVTGHSYIVYGPLANACTTLMFEGVPNHPTPSRIWEVVDRHRVAVLYTAPTAIRALEREGDDWVNRTSRASLRLLGTVGEPINPAAWDWYFRVVGGARLPIVDTWWQTETGGILISPVPGAIELKPGSATRPLPGVQPLLVGAEGGALPAEGPAEGNLCIVDSWPGQARTVWGDHERFLQTYFSTYPGRYFTGDGARRDADGDWWITGRVDDVLNVSGHRLGTAEIESALVAHARVAEAAVVGYPHDIKGQGVWAYVTLHAGDLPSPELRAELIAEVRRSIGPIAAPDVIQFAPGLPKTRSGKIMRRILRKIAEGETGSLGDTSTLADPAVVDDLVANRGG
jgi:acetyl-CoA synthetase